jgi:crossover junction endodeoxyribonuclease RusA
MAAKLALVTPRWSCAFRVIGTPEPKGSPKVLRLPNGRSILTVRTGKGERWERHVAQVAAQYAPPEPIDRPIRVHLEFALRPPKRPRWRQPDTRPDLDKLARAVLDALQRARLYVDDARVHWLFAEKRWAESLELPGVHVSVEIA